MAAASLVIGIVSIVLGFIPVINIFAIIMAIVGLILGIVAIATKNKGEKEKSQKSIGIVGCILNGVAMVVGIVSFIMFVSNFATIFNNEKEKFVNNPEVKEALGDIYDSMSEINKDKINYNVADEISGNKWKLKDGSLIILNKDNTFSWYKEETDLSDNYYLGEYRVYQGENAIKYIANDLSKYCITEEEQRDTIERNSKYHVYNYYCLILENEKCIVDGKNTMNTPTTSPYLGFYFNEDGKEVLDFANMNTASYYLFTKVK